MTELAVLVPVLGRPQNVAPLVASFLQGCPEDSYLRFICTPGDDAEIAAVKAVQEYPNPDRIGWLYGTPEGWGPKINTGVALIKADWYLCAADDVTFTEGWWDATKELRDDPTIGVIGTNDSRNGTGNPRVATGDHTCHPLIRAAYITERGTIDVPGEAVHAGYHHWFVDDELVWTAKTRAAWAFCREAVIEHLHPFWMPETVAWDDTYARGDANKEADGALFQQRAPLFGVRVQ